MRLFLFISDECLILWRAASFSTRCRNSFTEKLTTDEKRADIDRAARKVLSHICELNKEIFRASSVNDPSATSIARYVRLCAFISIENKVGMVTNKSRLMMDAAGKDDRSETFFPRSVNCVVSNEADQIRMMKTAVHA